METYETGPIQPFLSLTAPIFTRHPPVGAIVPDRPPLTGDRDSHPYGYKRTIIVRQARIGHGERGEARQKQLQSPHEISTEPEL
jgi:hypothetical protein